MPLYAVILPGVSRHAGRVRAATGKEAARLALRGAGVSLRQCWNWPIVKRIGP